MKMMIADGHGSFRRGLKLAIEGAMLGAVVLEAERLEEALSKLNEHNDIELALFDLQLFGNGSLDALVEAHVQYPSTRFVVISESDIKSQILAVLDAGLHGFISKRQVDIDILEGLRDVTSGKIYVPPSLAALNLNPTTTTRASAFPPRWEKQPQLTPRQRDVLDLITKGLSNKEIARKLNIAEPTTKIHAAALMRILGVKNRTEMAVMARDLLEIRAGVLPPPVN